jgi:prephenate dehydrogenase
MANPTIAIVGMGVIGRSMGLALKKAGGNFEIVGHDRELGLANQAKKLNAIDRTSWNLINATEGADLIIMAIPVSAMYDTLKAMAPYLKEGCLILDTCGVKAAVLEWADELLPEHVSFVGGDPIVRVPAEDAHKTGLDMASAGLLQNAIFCLCPSKRAKPEAVQLAANLVSALGAQPYFLDAFEHDGLVAGVEHLPAVLSAALLLTASRAPAWREMRKVAGESFARASQLPADTAPALRGASLSNAQNLTRWIDEIISRLQELKAAIAAGDEKQLDEMYEAALTSRDKWLHDRAQGFAGEDMPPRTEVPSYWKSLFGLESPLFKRRLPGRGDKEDKDKDTKAR